MTLNLPTIARTVAPWVLTAAAAWFGVHEWQSGRANAAALNAEIARRGSEFAGHLAKLETDNAGLRTALEAERKAGAHPVETFQGSTGPLVFNPGAVVEHAACPTATVATPVVIHVPVPAPTSSCPAPASQPVPAVRCALWPDEHPTLTAAGAVVAGKAGERRAHVDVTAWGSDPRRALFGGVISAPVTSEEPLATPPALRPRFGVWGHVLWDGPPTGAPSGVAAGADLRIWDAWWLGTSVHTARVIPPSGSTFTATEFGLGVRREFP